MQLPKGMTLERSEIHTKEIRTSNQK